MTWSFTDLPVSLRVPSQPASLRLVRLVVASLASDLGYDYEQIEDLRIAADETVSALMTMESAPADADAGAGHEPAPVTMWAGSREGVLEMGAIRQARDGGEQPFALDLLAAQIVAAIVAHVEVVSEGGTSAVFFRARPPSGVPA